MRIFIIIAEFNISLLIHVKLVYGRDNMCFNKIFRQISCYHTEEHHFLMPASFISVVLLYAMFSVSCIAQIYSPDSHYGDTVKYSPYTDSLFVFNEPHYGDKISITLAAQSPDSTDGWTFNWAKYDTIALDYTSFFSSTGISSETDTITTSAGYRLIISKGVVSDTSRVWVIFNDYRAEITSKDENNNLPIDYRQCNTTSFDTKAPENNLRYYIPGMDTSVEVNTDYIVTWEKDPEGGTLPAARFGYITTGNPPYDDAWYILHVRDSRFGLIRTDSVYYISIRSKAEMDTMTVPLYNSNYYPENYSKYYGEEYYKLLGDEFPAPSKFRFFDNGSKNTARFELDFGDNSPDTTFYEATDTILHEYLYPGTYSAELRTYSAEPNNCEDSAYMEILIANPIDSLVFPNVFTPNCDEKNDYFRINDVSIYDIDIIIYNRYGRKVHEYSGYLRDWPGWDGHIMGSKRQASEGIYYYVVNMVFAYEHIDNDGITVKNYSKNQKTGFVYLFRGENDGCE